MPIDEADLRDAIDDANEYIENLETDYLDNEEWVPAYDQEPVAGRIRLDLEAMEEDLSARELSMWRLGRIEGHGEAIDELERALFGQINEES